MNLGLKIKELRKIKKITQQDLAEMLGVSYQAISRWENNITSPDITALPILANIFNVTVDYLLDVNINDNDKIIKQIYKQSWDLCVKCNYKDAEILLEEKIKIFPNSYFLKNELLKIYYILMNDFDKELYQNKILMLANHMIDNCLIQEYRFSAIQTLIVLYASQGKYDLGKELLELLPDISYSKDMLKEHTLKGEEKELAIQEQTSNILNMFENIVYKLMFKYPMGKRSSFILKYKELLDLIYEDKDYGAYNYQLYFIYLQCAKDCALIFDKDKMLKYLEQAINHLELLFSLKEKKITIKHSSFMVNRIEDNPNDWPYDKMVIYNDLNKELQNSCYDFVKNDVSFTNLLDRIK